MIKKIVEIVCKHIKERRKDFFIPCSLQKVVTKILQLINLRLLYPL